MNRRREFLLVAWIGSATLALFAAKETGLRWNSSASMPIGLWRVTPPTQPLTRGEIVVFCMPEGPLTAMALERDYVGRGDCSSGVEPLLKPVAAIPGDTVVVSPQGISVNGELIPNTAQLAEDPAGRALPAWPANEYDVQDGNVWLVCGHTPLSFDGRYLGPARISQIRGTATPVLAW